MTPSDIIYKSKAYKILSRAFENDRVSSTYLLYGQEGSGRWFTAVSLAALLNCENVQKYSDDESVLVPCGECPNCRNIFNISYEGLKIALPIEPHENKIDKAIDLINEAIQIKRDEPFAILSSSRSTNIPISIAREIKKSLSMVATENSMRVVIFYKMEKMLTVGADALLKMIEEPPKNTVILLITDKPESLLKTIQSRSQKIKINNLEQEFVQSYLEANYEISEAKTRLAASVASGSIGRAIQFVEETEGEVSERSVLLLIFKSLFLDEPAETLAHMNDLLSLRDKRETEQLLTIWQHLIRDCANFSVTEDESQILNVDFAGDIKKLSSYFQSGKTAKAMADEIKITLADLKRNVHIQGALMALVLKLKKIIKNAR